MDKAKLLAAQAALGIAILAVWQGLVAVHVLDPFFVSRPSTIAARILTWIAGGTLWRHLAVTIKTGTFCSYVPDPELAVSWEL